ncbi:hyaluronan/mRNA binding family protein [Heterostelium album PN500]|uniref:Hyaluronan/mRNA binding family protein n=1 Tax=Heterostelium pallidum (strain ATCC 26659 / Pp 5 / PN500) TaxID=670386 RepID=D3B1N9_HETP5|nr:hyaluronan/mRNA binding family protein [Heterostelium album PN500]EFA85213.1 hyaluronan/mRNA binding family protein [Heterostelium album PN500]|eukprot:XP_020437322.1 hyaluronan/mRNA binding family protein [Heterostelium album PN500]
MCIRSGSGDNQQQLNINLTIVMWGFQPVKKPYKNKWVSLPHSRISSIIVTISSPTYTQLEISNENQNQILSHQEIVMSKNLFDLLQDDNEEPQEKVVKDVKPATKAPVTAAKKPAQAEKKPAESKVVKGDKPARVNGERKTERKPRTEVQGEDFQKSSSKRDSKPHTRTPRTDASGAPRGRQFDRKSGTGRPAGEVKKGGAGKGNWGSQTQEVQNTEAAVAVTETTEETATAVAATTETAETQAPKDTNITLEEYQKQQQAEAPQVQPLKLRQAGEGETNQWEEYAPIQKETVKSATKSAAKEKKNSKKTLISLETKPSIQSSNKPPRKGQKQVSSKTENKKIPELTSTDFPELKA